MIAGIHFLLLITKHSTRCLKKRHWCSTL